MSERDKSRPELHCRLERARCRQTPTADRRCLQRRMRLHRPEWLGRRTGCNRAPGGSLAGKASGPALHARRRRERALDLSRRGTRPWEKSRPRRRRLRT